MAVDVTSRYSSWLDDGVAKKYIAASKLTHDIEHLRAYVKEREGRNDVLFLGIFSRDGLEHIGNVKYEPIDFSEKFAVVGILIGESKWRGKGVAVEVLQQSSTWLHENHGIREIILGVASDNTAAIAAYKKIGFKQESTDRIAVDQISTISMVWHLDA